MLRTQAAAGRNVFKRWEKKALDWILIWPKFFPLCVVTFLRGPISQPGLFWGLCFSKYWRSYSSKSPISGFQFFQIFGVFFFPEVSCRGTCFLGVLRRGLDLMNRESPESSYWWIYVYLPIYISNIHSFRSSYLSAYLTICSFMYLYICVYIFLTQLYHGTGSFKCFDFLIYCSLGFCFAFTLCTSWKFNKNLMIFMSLESVLFYPKRSDFHWR